MAEITLQFLQQCRENVHKQGQERFDLFQQSLGALVVLDQLINHIQQANPPCMKDNVLGVIPAVSVDWGDESDKQHSH